MAAPAFQFNAKQWLGDEAVLAMDWDARAMHLHLMCLAWQQKEPGVLPYDPSLLRRWLGQPNQRDWDTRLFPQLLRAWKIDGPFLRQEGLARAVAKQNGEKSPSRAKPMKRQAAQNLAAVLAEAEEALDRLDGEVAMPDEGSGFNLDRLLSHSARQYQSELSEAEKADIWAMAMAHLRTPDFDETKTRSFLARQIAAYGERVVSQAVAEMSLKKMPPVEARSYLMTLLKTKKIDKKQRASVAL